ncbi:hypothetical protein AK51_16300 [Serratia nematodiphila DZ0503SBS1]|nr:hypothetical protein AK51_16300 [Serratia nematodiphila DZ0503SBS1]
MVDDGHSYYRFNFGDKNSAIALSFNFLIPSIYFAFSSSLKFIAFGGIFVLILLCTGVGAEIGGVFSLQNQVYIFIYECSFFLDRVANVG